MAVVLPLVPPLRSRAGDPLEALASVLGADRASVDAIILKRMGSDVPTIKALAEHIVKAGGKRLRPLLALASARLCGYNGVRHHALAASVEFIHTATLLHDDVVDSSLLRRGKPSANALFGNQASVLVGDFLLSQAFQLMVEDGSLGVLKVLSRVASIIAQGEIMQLATQFDCDTTEQVYLDVVRSKTAELFAAACRIGAIIASRPNAEEEALRAFGLNLGIAFQIVDDVLDYAADQNTLGKMVGDDFREGKVTLPVILAMAHGEKSEKDFFREAFKRKDIRANSFARAHDILMRCGALEKAMSRARHYGAIARDALAPFAEGPLKTALLDVVDFTIERRF